MFKFIFNKIVCFLGKTCYEKVKKQSNSIINMIFSSTKYEMNRIECLCDTNHSYKCQKDYCTVNEQACKAFTAIHFQQQVKSKLEIQCE